MTPLRLWLLNLALDTVLGCLKPFPGLLKSCPLFSKDDANMSKTYETGGFVRYI